MSEYAMSEWKTIYYVHRENNNKRIPRRVQAVSRGCTETHTGGISQILDGLEKHGAYFYGDAKVLRILGTDTETRSLEEMYCRRGSVSGRLGRDTLWSQVVPWLRQVRETGDTRWIKRRIVSDGYRKTGDTRWIERYLDQDWYQEAGDTRRESRNTSTRTGIRIPETPGRSRETRQPGLNDRNRRHLGPGEIWSGSGPDGLVVPAFILGRGDSPTWRIAQVGYDCERDADSRASEWARQHAQSGENKRESERVREIASVYCCKRDR